MTMWNLVKRLFGLKEVTAAGLRRAPKVPAAAIKKKGLEKAHTLSLEVAAKLWRQAFAHSTVNGDEFKRLRRFVSREENITVVCFYTNRTLHVNYDREILAQVTSANAQTLSPGAKKRLKEIVKVLKLGSTIETGKTKKFCERSLKILKKCK